MQRLGRCGGFATLVAVLTACTGEIGSQQPMGGPSETPDGGATSTTGEVPTTDGGEGSTPETPAEVDDSGEGAGEAVTGSACETTGDDVGPSVLRRLSRTEYQLTLQDLFQLTTAPSVEAIPPDAAQSGFTAYSEVQTVSPVLLRGYLQVADELADALFADAARRSQVIGCEIGADGCLVDFVTGFGARAYRRPLDEAEVSSITSRAEAAAVDAEDQFRFALEVMLSSPNFVHRVELGDAAEGLSHLSARELASRLSFAVWGRAASAELMAEADQGALDTEAGLHETATRMLGDEKARIYFNTFFREWLNYDEMKPPKEPPADWDDSLMLGMQEETDALMAQFAWTPATNFLQVLTANFSFMGAELAAFYGLPAPATDGRVDFPAGHPRENTGLLGQASVLSAKSDGDSVALRGNWLRSTFLCEKLYIDAAQLDAIGEELVGLTRMEIIAERNSRAQCAQCHSAIDPIGVGFEQFDATGRFDESVDLSSYPVAPAFPDAPDPSFGSIPELGQKLAGLPAVAACLSSRAFLYAHGRDPVAEDSCAVERATTEFIGSDHGFSELLLGLIDSPAFRLRRAPAP